MLLDRDMHIRYWGAGATISLGYAADEMIGRPIRDFLAADSMALCELLNLLMMTRQHSEDEVITCRHRDGHAVQMTGSATPLQDHEGLPAGLLLIGRSCRQCAGVTCDSTSTMEEINHRVRNTLAIICALLEMEMRNSSPCERDRLQTSLARIRGLVLIFGFWQHDSMHHVEVGNLAQAMLGSATSLSGQPGIFIPVDCPEEIHLCSRRGTYLGLVFTELATHLVHWYIAHPGAEVPMFTIRRDAREMVITVSAPVPPTGEIPSPVDALSREILVGLVERSLGGTITLTEQTEFLAVIRCPIDEAPTSRCE